MKLFDKKPITIEEQISILKSRNLVIDNEKDAYSHIKHIGYYHLSAYMLPFQNKKSNEHIFLDNINFEDIINLYNFDRQLRLLVIDAVERIEISIKSIIINEMCIRNGSHWFINKQFFIAKFNHDDFLRRIQSDIDYGKKTNNMSHICIKHYYTNYSSPELPPLWMIFEALSFGTISKLFANLNRQYQKLISDQLNMPSEILKSWLWSTSYIRNLCAHHSRLWNRIFTIKPLIPKDKKLYPSEFTRNDTFYAQAIILQIFMKNIASESLWGTKLIALINNSEFQKIDKIKMGINKNTFSSDLWKN